MPETVNPGFYAGVTEFGTPYVIVMRAAKPPIAVFDDPVNNQKVPLSEYPEVLRAAVSALRGAITARINHATDNSWPRKPPPLPAAPAPPDALVRSSRVYSPAMSTDHRPTL